MKELLVQFGRYHIWANQLLLEAINQLPEEKCRQEVPSSFNSLYTNDNLFSNFLIGKPYCY